MKLNIPAHTLTVLASINDFLSRRHITAYLVGGFVRDTLLGRETADIDIAVAADAVAVAAELAASMGGRCVILDRDNGVARVIPGGDDVPGEFDFSTVKGTLAADLKGRDFTIDALAVELNQLVASPTSPAIVDLFNGLQDLEQGIIRVVTPAAFKADPVRLLRAVRLAAELNFTIISPTKTLIRESAHLIGSVAGERVRDELLRVMAVPRSAEVLPYLDRLGLVTALIPELTAAHGFEQPKEHYWNVFDHSIMAVAAVDFLLHQGRWLPDTGFGKEYADSVLAATPWSPDLAGYFAQPVSHGSTRRTIMKMAALLHDVAKPQTKIVLKNRIRFLGHATEGAVIAANILERLRFSAKEIKLAAALVEHHLRPGQMSSDGLPTQRAIYRYFRDTGDAAIDTLFLSLADHLAARGPNLIVSHWQKHAHVVEYALQQHFEKQVTVAPPKLISGNDLIDVFGMKPGPEIGEFLERVREAQASGEIATREEALAYLRQRLSSAGEVG